MVGLSLVFMAVTLVMIAAYGIFATTMRSQVIARPMVMAWLRRTFGATYVLLAGGSRSSQADGLLSQRPLDSMRCKRLGAAWSAPSRRA